MKRIVPVIYLCLLAPPGLPAEEIPLVRQFLVNRDVVALAQAGYGEQTIIETILAKPNRFDTNTDALVELAAHGISERVVEAVLLAKACAPGCPQGIENLRGEAGHDTARQLPVAAKGVAYRALLDTRIDVRCLMAYITLSLASGELPPGLRLTMFGLEGVPLETGRFPFTVRVGNGCGSRIRAWELEVTGKPILEASPDEILFRGEKGPRAILVSSTWPNLPYHVEKQNADWLEVSLNSGRTPPAGSALTGDMVTLRADPSKVKPGTYRGALVFSTPGGANVQTVPVVLMAGGTD
jgi:hypothetical protein